MKNFSLLYDELDATTSTLEKVAALKKYFGKAAAGDAMWAVLLLTGRMAKKSLTSRNLRVFFLTATGYPEWLFEESYHHVGDTAETISLLLQSLDLTAQVGSNLEDIPLSVWIEKEIPRLAKIEDEAAQAEEMLKVWRRLDSLQVFLLNKLMTGGFRVGASEKLVIRALSEVFAVPTDQISHRLTGLTGLTQSGEETFRQLVSKEISQTPVSQPYPFCLAHAFADRKEETWRAEDWATEWKFDGIRAQVICRDQKVWIWSRGEDAVTDTFPELVEAFKGFPEGSVLDGEILVVREGKIQPFQELQKRLGRKKVSAAILKDYPVAFCAYDLLEENHQDIRSLPLRERRKKLERLIQQNHRPRISISALLQTDSLEGLENLRAQSREHDAEGLMLKAWDSPYVVGRKTGAWWKHKVDPLTLDAVLIYAQAGTGRRANLYTDYTFALWSQEEGEERQLVPFAKAYSGLDQDEINELDHWIRRHTREKFGPVRSLEAAHVFEIAFEGISTSSRHKSGIAVRFPRILRWRKDKKVQEADTLETALHLLHEAEAVL